MSAKRRNPKKNPAARRPRGGDLPGVRRARLELDDIARTLEPASAGALPLMALPAVWLWNMAQDGHPAAHCVDGCLVVHYALAAYGLASDIQAVGVRITAANGRWTEYNPAPRYHPDGTFDGHTILFVPGAGRFIDPTIQQFREVPRSPQNSLPLMCQMPADVRPGEDIFVIPRGDHTVTYLPFPEPERYAWQDPRIDAHAAEYREAGANLAANAFDIMRSAGFRDRTAESPYPRLRTLLAALDGMTTVADSHGYRFADPATGTELRLADIPEPAPLADIPDPAPQASLLDRLRGRGRRNQAGEAR